MAEADAQPENVASHKLSLVVLDEAHRARATKAINNVLSTDIAETTFAQIVDGVLARTKQFKSNFQSNQLTFDSKLLMEFQAASPGSRSFDMRLVEIVAVAIHQTAVMIMRLDVSCHKDNRILFWEPPEDYKLWRRAHPNGPPPTLFYHRWYNDYQQYPEGAADMVGYWAETCIFGGVVLFNRFEPESEAIYPHPERLGYTFRIYQLLDDQKRELLNFFTSDDPPQGPENCPLPILPSNDNMIRIDPGGPISVTGTYRDDWERVPRPFGNDFRSTNIWDGLNWPTLDDWNQSKVLWLERRARYMAGLEE